MGNLTRNDRNWLLSDEKHFLDKLGMWRGRREQITDYERVVWLNKYLTVQGEREISWQPKANAYANLLIRRLQGV